MKLGFAATFQNPGRELTDAEVYRGDLHLAKQAEGLGFSSVWTVEHHFTGYQMVPDPLLFLSHMAGTSPTLEVGSMCVVLPWHHDPVRVAEQAIMLDHYTQGRFVLGIARGAAPAEFAGFQIDMSVTRPMFIEYAQMIIEALETGVAEFNGQYLKQPRVTLRPEPFRTFKGRTYCGAVSPESMEIMARLGVGMLITPSKPWEVVAVEMAEYQRHFQKYQDGQPVPTIAVGWVFCDENPDRAYEIGSKYIKAYWGTVLEHYGFNKPENFRGKKGYEYYVQGAEAQQKMKEDEIAENFMKFHVWGTPEQCYDKIMNIRGHVGCSGFNGVFRYAGMPYQEADRNLKLFAKKVLPELRKVPDPTQFGAIQAKPELIKAG